MMVLDLSIVEGVGFNELFTLVINPFPNSNSFGNPDSFENKEKRMAAKGDSLDVRSIFMHRQPVSIESTFRYNETFLLS